jgi:ABC-type branched-subunit amino acid transport system ATPase component
MTKPGSSGFLLETNNIEVVYNDIIQVLRGVSLNVPESDIVAPLGTNGASAGCETRIKYTIIKELLFGIGVSEMNANRA